MTRRGMARFNAGDLPSAERDRPQAIERHLDIVQTNDTGWYLVRDLAAAHDDLADVLEARCAKSKDRPACLTNVAAEVAAERSLLGGLKQKGHLPKADEARLATVTEREAKLKHGGR
jgi:hypothetical protein